MPGNRAEWKISRAVASALMTVALLVTGCALPTELFPGGGTRGASTTGGGHEIRNVRMCTEPDGKKCPEDVAVFSPTDPSIAVTAEVTNVEEGMKLIFVWKYLGGDPDVAPFTIAVTRAAAEKSEPVRPVTSAISKNDPNKEWASGDYVVEIREDVSGSEPVTKEFKVR